MGRRKSLPAPEAVDEPTALAEPTGPEAEHLAELRAMPFAARVDQVIIWLCQGQRHIEVEKTTRQAWGPDGAKAIKEAVGKKFEESGQASALSVRGWILESRMELYRQLVEIGDQAGAARILRDIEASAK